MTFVVLALAGVMALAPAAARGQARLVGLSCAIGSGRTHVLVPRAEEETSDDELTCRAELAGRFPATGELAGELRIFGPEGVRVVAMGLFEREGERAKLDGLVVPHSTWATAVSWADRRRPRLRVELRVYRKPASAASARRAWRLVASGGFFLGAEGRRR
jgi:hypothetical protein